jgi:C-terminal processing protease CtpA/Prc
LKEYDVPLRKAILIIRSLLLNQFKETNGVLFDVRDSPGGTIHYAATLVQLFKGESSHVYDRYRRNNVTDEIIKQRYAENSVYLFFLSNYMKLIYPYIT